jgi:hypothetical protein
VFLSVLMTESNRQVVYLIVLLTPMSKMIRISEVSAWRLSSFRLHILAVTVWAAILPRFILDSSSIPSLYRENGNTGRVMTVRGIIRSAPYPPCVEVR